MKNFPKISVIVPSFNQSDFIEETLLSILNQDYPNLELIVIDGGSTDGSLDIIRKYERHIFYWVSESDNGQSHAINKGLRVASGEWLAWMNSDDCYLQGALKSVFQSIDDLSSKRFIYGSVLFGQHINNASRSASKSLKYLTHLELLLFFKSTEFIIPSQSVFIHKKLFESIGFLNESYHYCMDLDWYSKVFSFTHANERFFIDIPYSFFRIHDNSKTSLKFLEMQKEALNIAEVYAVFLSNKDSRFLLEQIEFRRWFLREFYIENNRDLIVLIKGLIKFKFVAIQDKGFIRMAKRIIRGSKIGI